MITVPLIKLIYQAAHIQRWNDHLRPHKGFTELDKQAHKMLFAYVIGRCEEDRGNQVNWRLLIEGGIFEFLQRILLTDIKPPIYYRLMSESGPELNNWVLAELKDKLEPVGGDFLNKFSHHLLVHEDSLLERKILRAAHYLATNWEFGLIYNLNKNIYGVEETKERIENELEDHYDLLGVQKIGLHRKAHKFLDLVGQLRFQQRWAQSPRVPETSVLGHMLIVAMLSYLCSVELKACDRRIYNNFFAGLFHDLPEVLTRDIVSPVKRSVQGLEQLIKEIESRQLEERILPLLPASWHQELQYFIEDEFASKVVLNGRSQVVKSDDINLNYNEDCYDPLDGELIRACDHLAAYMEAHLSLSHGIKSLHLEQGIADLSNLYRGSVLAGVDFGKLYLRLQTELGS